MDLCRHVPICFHVIHGDKSTLALTIKQTTNFLTSLAFVIHTQYIIVGRVIATCYGQSGLGIEFLRGRVSPYPPRRPPMPKKSPARWILRLFHDLNSARDGLDHPVHLAPKLNKERSCNFTPLLSLSGLLWGEVL